MEMEFEGRQITLNKELSKLDELALRFSDCLNALEIENVFLSGYVAILFGRNRASEAVDCICKPISYERFVKFWELISEDLECIITSNIEDAYKELTAKGFDFFVPITDTGKSKIAFFRGPDNITIELLQPLGQ